MIKILDDDLNYSLSKILSEYQLIQHNEKNYSDSNNESEGIDYWRVIRHKDMTSDYCKRIQENFKNTYDIFGKVDARYYRLLANRTLPWHVDRSTQCSLNMVLSEKPAPILFRKDAKTYEYDYKIALINTQIEHSVSNGPEDRLLFKISIFDETFDSVASKIT